MHCETCTERDLKTEWFQNALAENRFETWFQPVVDTSGHRIPGHECLIRVSAELDPGAGVRGGEEIIEAARAGNHLPLFDSRAMALAVRSAAGQYRHLESSGGKDPGVFFVNMLHGSMVGPKDYMRLVMEALAAARQTSAVRPEDIVFEAVDSDLTGDSARLRALHEYIRKQGCGFALDNAGLGFGRRQGEMGSNCFEMIRDLRPDYVKIDRRLVWNIEQPLCASTIRKLVELSDRYRAKVIAVGVERQRMVENLWLLGVQIMQGYLFGRPSPQIARSAAPMELQADSDLANLARAISPVPRICLNNSGCNHESPLFADLN